MESWQAIADAINTRMTELDISQRELADRSGVSVATLREIQHATANRRRSARTLAAISRALNWPDNHLAGVLGRQGRGAGTSPIDATAMVEVIDRLDAIHREVGRLADAVERLAEQSDGAA